MPQMWGQSLYVLCRLVKEVRVHFTFKEKHGAEFNHSWGGRFIVSGKIEQMLIMAVVMYYCNAS